MMTQVLDIFFGALVIAVMSIVLAIAIDEIAERLKR